MTPEYFDRVWPTYIENWSHGLIKLSIRQTEIPLNMEEALSLGMNNSRFAKWFKNGNPKTIDAIAGKLKNALWEFREGAFVRLGSRSAKDTQFAKYYGLRVDSADAAIRMLTDNSERITFDLRLGILNQYSPSLFVRDWVEMPKWSEFRCFMRKRKLIGVSQYDCKNLGRCSEIHANSSKIFSSIKAFFEKFSYLSHIDDVVFDVFVIIHKKHDNHSIEVKLLDLNPFFPKTDSCLFQWRNGGDFDGGFRFL